MRETFFKKKDLKIKLDSNTRERNKVFNSISNYDFYVKFLNVIKIDTENKYFNKF